MKTTALRLFPLVTGIFVTTLIISNIIAVKLVNIFGFTLPAAIILFPVAYIFGDVLTEVYGYARTRQVIWIGFFCNLIAVIAIWLGGLLPAAAFWDAGGVYATPEQSQQAYLAILGFTPRLLAASFIAYLVGEFLNAFVLARLKIRTQGRHLWVRTIASTIVGQGADSALFITVAFAGLLPPAFLLTAILSQWLFKVAFEALATPFTYLLVDRLKKIEGMDYFDVDTNFSPIGGG